jgi:isopenicillin N synthase-like dioxygenase
MRQDAAGLQLMPRDPDDGGHGDWVDAPVRVDEFVVIVGDMLERLTNGELLATPHRVLPTSHARNSIIRFNAFRGDVLVAPMPQFVTAERPARYSAVTMERHMETTMKNLEAGLGSWDSVENRSRSAAYDYYS